jgi:hypothetical protein
VEGFWFIDSDHFIQVRDGLKWNCRKPPR